MAVTWSASSHYLNQWCDIVNWTIRNKLQWNFNQNHNIFFQENAFESVVWKTAAILSRPQCVKGLTCGCMQQSTTYRWTGKLYGAGITLMINLKQTSWWLKINLQEKLSNLLSLNLWLWICECLAMSYNSQPGCYHDGCWCPGAKSAPGHQQPACWQNNKISRKVIQNLHIKGIFDVPCLAVPYNSQKSGGLIIRQLVDAYGWLLHTDELVDCAGLELHPWPSHRVFFCELYSRGLSYYYKSKLHLCNIQSQYPKIKKLLKGKDKVNDTKIILCLSQCFPKYSQQTSHKSS